VSGKLGVVGIGVMGKALAQGLMAKQVYTAQHIWAAARTEATCQAVSKNLGIAAYRDYQAVLAETDTLLLCVKPAQAASVLARLKTLGLRPDTLVISIVAGFTLAQMADALGPDQPVIRAMTNTPCLVGQGMTALCGGPTVSAEQLTRARLIFEAVGSCVDLDESYFNAVTGLSGSGPAYLYLIMEALADGGVRVGLPRETALKIVSQMVLGAATMVQQSGRHPAALRDDVTTPAGCTIGALLTLEDGKIRSVLARAVEEATAIAGQLGQPPAPKN
jgi:pyrroline-5-carboxylate reductase